MTPPETPKPITEKELEEMEIRLQKALTGTLGNKMVDGYTTVKDCDWIFATTKTLIAELKRLRAGPTREKILRDGIEEIALGEAEGIEGIPGDNIELTRIQLIEIAQGAIEEADAVEDGLNQEDLDKIVPARTERLSKSFDDPDPKIKAGPSVHDNVRMRGIIASMNGKRVGKNGVSIGVHDYCWMESELKKYMGIE